MSEVMTMLKAVGNPTQHWGKINVTRELRTAVKRIAADQNKFIYYVAEEAFRQMYPNYFQNQEVKN
jgi:hypothetical protein